MAFIPAFNTVKVEFIYTFENSVNVNAIHFHKLTDWVSGEYDILIAAAVDWHSTWLSQWQVPSYVLAKVRTTNLDDQNAPGFEFSVSAGAGTDTAESPLPANCAAQIQWNTRLRGRSYRGRMFVGGIAETRATGSTLDTAYKAGLATAAANLLLIGSEIDGAEPVVVSRIQNKTPRTSAECTLIEGYSISPYIVSQRRRLPGRGV